MLGLCLCLSGCASGPSANYTTNSPGIFVKGSGATTEAAFKDAVRKASGVVIASQMEASGDKLVKDEILDYSSGYIQSYTIIKETPGHVEITAIVSSDKITNRLLGRGISKAEVASQSQQIYGQVTSLIAARKAGDALLNNLVNEYPGNALTVKIGTLSPMIDNGRETYLDIPITITWSKGYLTSLEQTVAYLSSEKCYACSSIVKFSNGTFDMGKLTGYKLADDTQQRIVDSGFTSSVGVELTFHSTTGDSATRCYKLDLQVSSSPPINQLVRYNYDDHSTQFFNSIKVDTIRQPVNYKFANELAGITAAMVRTCK
jgi:hypothetical protein